MGVRADFTSAYIAKLMEKPVKYSEQQIIYKLKSIGQKYVIAARSKASDLVVSEIVKGSKVFVHPQGPRKRVGPDSPSFQDQTGGLRSSIGYLVLKNGKAVAKDFDAKDPSGQKLAKKIAKEHPKGYALIVVAGMDYAAAVESKGFDVITGSSFEAIKEFTKNFKRK